MAEAAKPAIGFIGLGHMGRPMAARLRDAGYTVRVWNRTASKAREFAEGGGEAAATPAVLAGQSDVVILALADDAAVVDVLLGTSGLLAAARPGTTILDMSTVAPATARHHAATAAAHRIQFLDAPVSGSTAAAESGQLVIMVGGDRAAFDALQPILSTLGKAAYYLGESGSGAMAKLVVNTMLGGLMAVLSESLCLGQKAGLDPAQLVEIISNTSSGAPLVKARGPNMVQGRFPSAFPLRLMTKDFSLITAEARQLGVPMPTAAVVAELYQARNNRGQEEDFSAVFGLLRELAGLG